MFGCSFRRRVTVLLGAIVGVAALTAGLAGAGSSLVSGRFTSDVISGPGCTSPDGLCMQGTLTGALKGTFSFTAADVFASADTPTTGVVHYIGDMEIQTKGGTLTCKLAGVLKNTGGPLTDVCSIVAGTGAFAGATGDLISTGTFSLTEGAEGEYEGDVVQP